MFERTAVRLVETATHPANKGGRRRALGRAVTWEWKTRIRRDATAADVVVDGKTRLRVHPGQLAAVWTAYNGLHEWEELQLILGYLRPGDRFIDVGANVGVFSCLVGTRLPGVDIIAIEPFPATQEAMRDNLARNGLDDVVVAAYAVGAEEGTASFEVMPRDVLNRLVPGGGTASSGESITVAVHTLDDVVGEAGAALMKIDVEGAELDVFRGATRLMSGPNPPVIMFETIGHAKTFGYSDEEVLDFVRDHGYQVLLLDGHLTPWDERKQPPTDNVVATRDVAALRQRLASPGGAAPRPPVPVEVTYLRDA
jgi:FkbM family methyltransferase